MILEAAYLQVKPGEAPAFEAAFRVAQAIIASMPGYRSHELQRCLEREGHYLLLVRWDSVAAHEEGFRKSPQYLEWKRLLHHFYDPFPTVLHYEPVAGASPPPGHHLRIARPVAELERSVSLYCEGLDLRVLGRFRDHEGFDGAMLGRAGMGYHFEFTRCTAHPVRPAPSVEDLAVFYVPETDEWARACERMLAAGFKAVASFNPYWDRQGRSFEDPDGYRMVLQRAGWENREIV